VRERSRAARGAGKKVVKPKQKAAAAQCICYTIGLRLFIAYDQWYSRYIELLLLLSVLVLRLFFQHHVQFETVPSPEAVILAAKYFIGMLPFRRKSTVLSCIRDEMRLMYM